MVADGVIDLNRGVQKRVMANGVAVIRYVDDPCTFYSVHGTPVSEDLARQSGFDVDELKKKCILKKRIAEASDKIKAELEAETEVGSKTVVEERQGFKVLDIGLGRCMVVDPDGNNLHTEPLTKEQASKLLKDLTPEVS